MFPRKTAAAVYEGLASSGKEALILRECSDVEVVNMFVRKALKSMIQLTDGEDVATGLERLQGMEQKRFQESGQKVTAHNIEELVLSAALPLMLTVDKYFPDLIKNDDLSFISSSDMVEIDLDRDLTNEE